MLAKRNALNINYGSVIVCLYFFFSFQDTVSVEEQTVVSVADCSSNFGDPVSASRVSSEDYGNDLHLDNEMGQTETDMQKSERIHVEQVRNIPINENYNLIAYELFRFQVYLLS